MSNCSAGALVSMLIVILLVIMMTAKNVSDISKINERIQALELKAK